MREILCCFLLLFCVSCVSFLSPLYSLLQPSCLCVHLAFLSHKSIFFHSILMSGGASLVVDVYFPRSLWVQSLWRWIANICWSENTCSIPTSRDSLNRCKHAQRVKILEEKRQESLKRYRYNEWRGIGTGGRSLSRMEWTSAYWRGRLPKIYFQVNKAKQSIKGLLE